jgi:hypothetical protein
MIRTSDRPPNPAGPRCSGFQWPTLATSMMTRVRRGATRAASRPFRATGPAAGRVCSLSDGGTSTCVPTTEVETGSGSGSGSDSGSLRWVLRPGRLRPRPPRRCCSCGWGCGCGCGCGCSCGVAGAVGAGGWWLVSWASTKTSSPPSWASTKTSSSSPPPSSSTCGDL